MKRLIDEFVSLPDAASRLRFVNSLTVDEQYELNRQQLTALVVSAVALERVVEKP